MSKKTAEPKPKIEPRISKFKSVPGIQSNREYHSTYDFSTLKPGQKIVVDITAEGDEEKKEEVNRIRASLYSAFYRFKGKNPEAEEWERAIRATNDDSGSPIDVGFYRIK